MDMESYKSAITKAKKYMDTNKVKEMKTNEFECEFFAQKQAFYTST